MGRAIRVEVEEILHAEREPLPRHPAWQARESSLAHVLLFAPSAILESRMKSHELRSTAGIVWCIR